LKYIPAFQKQTAMKKILTLTAATPLSPTNLTINNGAAGTYSAAVNIIVTDPNISGLVTGWYISENSPTPTAGAAGWTASAPTSYTFTGSDGINKPIYTWVKNGTNVQTIPATSTTTLDRVTPYNPQWKANSPYQASTNFYDVVIEMDVGCSGLSTNLSDYSLAFAEGWSVTLKEVYQFAPWKWRLKFDCTTPSGVPGATLKIGWATWVRKIFTDVSIETETFF